MATQSKNATNRRLSMMTIHDENKGTHIFHISIVIIKSHPPGFA